MPHGSWLSKVRAGTTTGRWMEKQSAGSNGKFMTSLFGQRIPFGAFYLFGRIDRIRQSKPSLAGRDQPAIGVARPKPSA